MNRWHPFGQLVLARLRDFYREPVALFWVYGFPLILAIGLGVAFSQKIPEPPTVDVQIVEGSKLSAEIAHELEQAEIAVTEQTPEACAHRLKTGKTNLTIVPSRDDDREHILFVFDRARPESVSARYQVENVLHRRKTGDSETWTWEDSYVVEPGTRYIDFLMPGLIGMNLMGGGLWGMGFVLVDMRVRKLLKRLLATPMRRGDFLLALSTARLILIIPEMTLLVLVSVLLFRVPLDGNPLTLILVILVGGAAFSGIGLLVACRTEKTETVSGLMNLVMLPQWLLSGTFFSSKRFPEVLQPLVQALPLTQLNDSLREVMLEGAGLRQVGWRIGVLAAWGAMSFFLALRWFRWR
jgi:ABC transporter DrrB family efflux protein